LLLEGLSGNVDVGGTWYNPQNQPLASNVDTASNFPGQFNYDYIVNNGVCPNDTANVLIIVDPSCNYIGLENQELSRIELYPNPTSNFITLSNPEMHQFELEIRDLNGKLVYENEVSSSLVEISLNNALPGVYLVHLTNSNGTKVIRVIKQ
jgi:hypothetical protein